MLGTPLLGMARLGLALLGMALPALLTVGADLWRRGDRLAAVDLAHTFGYIATALVSLFSWGALLFVAASGESRHWRALAGASFVLAFGLASAVQDAFFERYNVYVALDAQRDAESVLWALVGSLPVTGGLLIHLAGWSALAFACHGIATRVARRGISRYGRPAPWLCATLILGAMGLLMGIPTSYRGVQSSTPDVLYLHALRIGIFENAREALGGRPRAARFQLRHPPQLPALRVRSMPQRNVLVIMQEAVRADMACPDPDVPCDGPSAPSHRVTPRRIPFRQMRAVSSSTAVALATTWSGQHATAPREALFSAPLIWDYAAAAGYSTGYWTSQHPMFANTRLLVQGSPRDHCVWATEIDPAADYLIGADDELVVRRALADLDRTAEPFLGVVHLSNVHMPRRIDPRRAPFQPSDTTYQRDTKPRQRNFYRNSVYLSELAVAELISGVRARAFGARTVIVYLSDHGEAWFEHDQHNDHGSTLFDEEIRIPAWIDGPVGTLTSDEEEHLRAVSDEPIFQTAITPTVLDLLGLWDAKELRHFIDKMPGFPLTRPRPAAASMPGASAPAALLTNVSWAWEYGDPNWAVMRGPLKLLATGSDGRYRCFDVASDPGENDDLGPSACGDLLRVANDVFAMLPRDLGRLREHPTWGWPR